MRIALMKINKNISSSIRKLLTQHGLYWWNVALKFYLGTVPSVIITLELKCIYRK